MAKVLYNGKYIELCDELEPGFKELDLITDYNDDKNINLEDTLTFKPINLDDTQILDLGDING